MKTKKIIKIVVVMSIFVTLIGIGTTYSLWSKTFSQSGENKLVSDCFHITFQEVSGSSITLENAYPIVDEEGKKLTPYEFSITNQCSVPVEYQINFETTKETTMKEEYVKLMFQEMGPFSLATYGSQIRQISSWYSDEAWFAQNTDPWFRRGGGMYVGMEAGNFSFFKDNGRAHIYFSFRVVLSVSLD